MKSEWLEAPETNGARLLRMTLNVIVFSYLMWDLFKVGLSPTDDWVLDYWDLVATSAFVKGRHLKYSLRDQESFHIIDMIYVFIISYAVFYGNGIVLHSIMAKSIVLPSLFSIIELFIVGFLPAQLSPGDYLFWLSEKDDVHQSLVCLWWGIAKGRQLLKAMHSAYYLQYYGFLQMLIVGTVACEFAPVSGRAEVSIYTMGFEKAVGIAGKGFQALLRNTSFHSSIVGSIFVILAVWSTDIMFVEPFFGIVATIAFCYRYGNGVFERVFYENEDFAKLWNIIVHREYLQYLSNPKQLIGVYIHASHESWYAARDLLFEQGKSLINRLEKGSSTQPKVSVEANSKRK